MLIETVLLREFQKRFVVQNEEIKARLKIKVVLIFGAIMTSMSSSKYFNEFRKKTIIYAKEKLIIQMLYVSIFVAYENFSCRANMPYNIEGTSGGWGVNGAY